MSPLQILGYVVLGIVFLSFVSNLLVTGREEKRWKAVLNAWKQSSFSPEEVRQEIDAYQDMYLRVHPAPYHSLSKDEFERLFSDLKDGVESDLTRNEVYCMLADAVSHFNDEHIQVGMPTIELNQLLGEKDKVFPYHVAFLDDRCFIRAPRGEVKSLPAGTEILSINGISASEIMHRITHLYWGTSDKQRAIYAQRYFTEALYLAYGFEDWFDVLVRMPDGEEKERRLKGIEYQIQSKPPFSYQVIDDLLYFDYREFVDPEGKFKAFLAEMFTIIQNQSITKLVIDLRGNQGGTTSYGDQLLRYLTDQSFSQFDRVEIQSSPEVKRFFLSFLPAFMHWFFPLPYLHPMLKGLWRTKQGELAVVNFQPLSPSGERTPFNGDVYVLIDAGSMSSSSLLAATIQTYKIGKLVGQDTGGYATHYGNMLDLHLPITGLKVMIPSSINHGNGTGPVKPDIQVDQKLDDLIAGKDTVLEKVRKL
jgi:hypothetical protein